MVFWEEGTSEEAVERVGVSEFEGLTREELLGIILEFREATAALKRENDELRSRLGGKVIPSWVKANKPTRPKKERIR